MNLLYYNELDYSTVKPQFKKVEKYLATNNFKSADIKKMVPTEFFRAKLDKTNRLLFKFAKYNGKSYILLLEVILNHDYESSKFLRGATVNEDKFEVIEKPEELHEKDIKPLVYLNDKKRHFHMLDKVISFDEAQNEIYDLPTPLTIIGSAGSGKTVLTLEKLKKLQGRVAYLSLSPYLVENAQNTYYSNNYDNDKQEIDFLSFKEFLQSIKIPKGSELEFRTFEQWFVKHFQKSKINEPYRLFEEFKGVLTGSVVDAAYLTEAQYLKLGVKQSIFLKNQRTEVYSMFVKYLKFLKQTPWYDTNMLAYEYLEHIEPQYDFVVIDEVQDITNIQLKLILASLKNINNFMLSGDSNQIVHPNFFSWSKIKTLFFNENFNFSLIRILTTNYRNSKEVTALSNNLLKIKNLRFGSIDKESTYLIDSVSEKKGDVFLLKDDKKVKRDLNAKTQNSTKFAVLVMNNHDKRYAKQAFKTPLVFSIQEAKGLEYENIILLNFVSNSEKEFNEIVKGIAAETLDDPLKYGRAKDKEDKDLEVYKFFINSLYVAFTRSVKNLYIIEDKKEHRLFNLLKLQESKQKVQIEAQKSDENEWLEEARKLELQGKHEQAREIRDKVAGVKYISPQEYEELKKVALNPDKTEQEVKRERKDLFRYAEARKNYDDIQQLADLRFVRAIAFIKQINEIRKNYDKACRLNRLPEVQKIVKEQGVDFKTKEGLTGLLLAVQYANLQSVEFFINKHANIQYKINDQNALQLAIKATYRYELLKDRGQKNDTLFLKNVYNKLKSKSISCYTSDKLVKIGNHLMEFYLVNFLVAAQSEIVQKKQKKAISMFSDIELNYISRERREMLLNSQLKAPETNAVKMDDLMAFIEKMPKQILPEYRRKRQYVNSILASNEVDRAFIYNKKLFKRIARGCYVLNPDIRFEEELRFEE